MGQTYRQYSKMVNDWNNKLDIKTVKRLMRRHKMSVNTIFYEESEFGKWQSTFLHHAIRTGNVQLINWLFARKVDVNISLRELGTPIFYALSYEDLATTRKLVRLGARLNVRQPGSGFTPLFYAEDNDSSIAKLFIKNGADVNMEVATGGCRKGYSPLQIYAQKGNIEVVKLILSAGVDVNHKSADGFTPLINAAHEGNLEIVKLLLDLGADINCKSKRGYTPMNYAVRLEDQDMVKLLLDRGVNIGECITDCGITPFIWAINDGNLERSKLLLDHGAEIDTVCKEGEDVVTPVHNALWSRKVEILEFIFELYETISPVKVLTGKKKQSLLHYAYCHGLTGNGVIDFLLNVGVNVNLEDRDRKLAIDYKAWNREEENHLEMKKHFVKLMSANLPVCQKNVDAIGNELEDFAAECREEVTKIKNTKIGDVHTSFFDVLHVSEHKLVVKVKFLQIDFLDKEKLREIFPLYGGMLFYILFAARKRMLRLESAEEKLVDIFMCCDLPYDFFKELFNYLSEFDLRIIIGEKIPDLSKVLSL